MGFNSSLTTVLRKKMSLTIMMFRKGSEYLGAREDEEDVDAES